MLVSVSVHRRLGRRDENTSRHPIGTENHFDLDCAVPVRIVGAEGRYSYLAGETAEASDDSFRFTTTRTGGVLALTGRAGVRAGRFRPFGRAGLGLHRATLTTTQTLNDTTIVVDDVEQTVPGGTQILQMRTKGWAPVYGGGVEIWLSPSIGIYGEAQRIGLKGTDDRGSGIKTEDAVITAQIGLTIRFP